ncbi:MAG: alpha/beta hydrolase [Lachnospiraceae bacterium]|nr:alpha/beta hydrolase [Lachnospiraceae bacterium]
MKIEVLGDKKKPAVLLVHGMFCNADSVKHFAKYLQDEYYVIVPTMSGHYPGSADYISKEKEAEAMLKYLHDNEIEELALLQGTSMGAEVAYRKKCFRL